MLWFHLVPSSCTCFSLSLLRGSAHAGADLLVDALRGAVHPEEESHREEEAVRDRWRPYKSEETGEGDGKDQRAAYQVVTHTRCTVAAAPRAIARLTKTSIHPVSFLRLPMVYQVMDEKKGTKKDGMEGGRPYKKREEEEERADEAAQDGELLRGSEGGGEHAKSREDQHNEEGRDASGLAR